LFEGKGQERRLARRLGKVRFAQKQQALDLLTKHLGLFKDAGPTSQTLIFQQINELIDETA